MCSCVVYKIILHARLVLTYHCFVVCCTFCTQDHITICIHLTAHEPVCFHWDKYPNIVHGCSEHLCMWSYLLAWHTFTVIQRERNVSYNFTRDQQSASCNQKIATQKASREWRSSPTVKHVSPFIELQIGSGDRKVHHRADVTWQQALQKAMWFSLSQAESIHALFRAAFQNKYFKGDCL